jgi:hypothetical protein
MIDVYKILYKTHLFDRKGLFSGAQHCLVVLFSFNADPGASINKKHSYTIVPIIFLAMM